MLILNKMVISINDNNALRHILYNNPKKQIIFIIKSTGGYISSSDSILNLLDSHNANKTVYIPSYAMSAATLLAFACDSIYMNKYAVIGPTDPQISIFDEMFSFRAVNKLVKNKPLKYIKDNVLIQYYENKILYDENIKIIIKYINKHKKINTTQKEINELIKMFSLGDIPHHREINLRTLKKVLKINLGIPEDIMRINNQINYIFEIM
jgi:ClpP class serine protease